jgi:NADPH-dependent ferric siderophore reductase
MEGGSTMTYEYIAYVSSGNVSSGNEVLRVTAEGEFIWNENADEMIASGDYSQYPALRHVLKALRQNERLQDMLYEQLGELTALRAEKQMRTRIEQLKEQPK